MRTTLGIVGGTGKLGMALARRWALSHDIVVGSRDPARAQARAAQAGAPVRVGSNEEAACAGEVVALAVPYAAHAATLRALAPALMGKVVLDMTVPLAPDDPTVVRLPPGRAAALEAQALLGEAARVVAALHHVSAARLGDLERPLDGDALVVGDDADAKVTVLELVAELGLRGLDAGPLQNAIAVESLTPLLLYIHRRYGMRGAGISIVGGVR